MCHPPASASRRGGRISHGSSTVKRVVGIGTDKDLIASGRPGGNIPVVRSLIVIPIGESVYLGCECVCKVSNPGALLVAFARIPDKVPS